MFWFFAGLSLGTCLGVVVAALCFAAGRSQRSRRMAHAPAALHPATPRTAQAGHR